MKRNALVLLPLALLALAGCDPSSPGPACTTEFVYGLTVEARDAATGAPLSVPALIVAREGSYRDTLRAWPDGITYVGAGERPGTYRLTAEAEGYGVWEAIARVTANECHVNPVRLTASLQPR